MINFISMLILAFNLLTIAPTYQVKDAITGEILCGVSVQTSSGKIFTDLDGHFTAHKGDTATFSTISYQDTTMQLNNTVIYLKTVK